MSIIESSDTEQIEHAESVEVLPPENVVVASNAEIPQMLSDESILAYTQNARLGICNQLLKNGSIPEDKSEKVMLMNALDGLDRQVINKKRVEVEADRTNQLAAAAESITHLLNTVSRDVFQAQAPVERVLPELPMECVTLVENQLVVGELNATYHEETIEEFRSRTDKVIED